MTCRQLADLLPDEVCRAAGRFPIRKKHLIMLPAAGTIRRSLAT
jgi:hypothetical protein